MIVGTVREIKNHEYRVGLTPQCARRYVEHGHEVFVEKNAGGGAGYEDQDYTSAGANVVDDRAEVFDRCKMVVKVKEPLPEEYGFFKPGQILFTYLHLASNPSLTEALLSAEVKAVAYETIESDNGRLPCLKPMSEIAGRLSVQEGAKYLEKPSGGRGVLLGGIPGVNPARAVIIGGGTVGTNACKVAVGLGADVTVLDLDPARLEYLDDIFNMQVKTLYSNETNMEYVIPRSDLIIGAVLVPGAKAPEIITKKDLDDMKKRAVIVDVSIDQGGCCETSHPTTHDDPVFVVNDVVHYCVANMPGAVPVTSTQALVSNTLPYGLMIANHGLEEACSRSQALKKGLNLYCGDCVHKEVSDALGLD